MSVVWSEFAEAITGKLNWERLCGRGNFLTETSLHRAIAEYVQAATTLAIQTEYNHPDISGNKRLDLVGFGPQGKSIQLAVEAKWIKSDGAHGRGIPRSLKMLFVLSC